MAESKQLDILKALTAHLEGAVTVDGEPLTKRVYRGRLTFGSEMPLPSISILEAPRPEDGFTADEEQVQRSEDWVLLIQGWVRDDDRNPTDPAYNLKATIEQRLSLLVATNPSTGQPVDPDAFMLGGRVTKIVIAPGLVRPPDAQVSAKAFFYLPLIIGLAVDIRSPFVD